MLAQGDRIVIHGDYLWISSGPGVTWEATFADRFPPDWNPTTNGHVHSRLPPVASHQPHGRWLFLVQRKVRKHVAVWRVLGSALAGLTVDLWACVRNGVANRFS